MAKLRGPALSQLASGKIADALSFTRTPTGVYIRKKPRPADPATPAQIDKRQIMRWLQQHWATITPTERQTWEPIARQYALPLYCAYLRHNMLRWTKRLPPTRTYPGDTTTTTTPPPLFALTGEVRQVKIAVTWIGSYGQRPVLIARKTATPYPDTKTPIILACQPVALGTIIVDETPTPGIPNYYSFWSFSATGQRSTTKRDYQVTPLA